MSNKYYINIWDDFSDDEPGVTSKTHVQIETKAELDLNEEKAILTHFFPLLQQHLPEVVVSLYLYDTQVLYPHMDKEACDSVGFIHRQTYHLKLEGITHEKLDSFMDKVEGKNFDYHGHEVMFISES